MELHKELKALGVSASNNNYEYNKPAPKLLERFPSPYAQNEMNPKGVEGFVEIKTSEFSSLCPLTHQADWATIIVEYIPDQWCVESKSFKLFLASFRNHGEFHESVICRICNDLVALLDPTWIRVKGEFAARGGISFHPTAEWGKYLTAWK
jgi:7-cyano-7-deazaguanine reductase